MKVLIPMLFLASLGFAGLIVGDAETTGMDPFCAN